MEIQLYFAKKIEHAKNFRRILKQILIIVELHSAVSKRGTVDVKHIFRFQLFYFRLNVNNSYTLNSLQDYTKYNITAQFGNFEIFGNCSYNHDIKTKGK